MDEWNVWYAWYRPSNVTDGIFAALTLHMLFTEARSCGIEQACHFEAINEGLLEVKPNCTYLTAQGQVFSVMKHHLNGQVRYKKMNAFATVQDGVLTITAVNEAYDQPKQFRIASTGQILTSYILTSDTVIPPSFFHKETIELEKAGDYYTCMLPPHSIMLLQLTEES